MDKNPSFSLICCLYFCVFLSVFAFTGSLMAGPYIVGSLGGSDQISSYTVVFYGLGNALVFPLSSKLARRYGKVKVLLVSLVFFAVFNLLCGMADTFFLFLVFRFLQGVAAGTFFPIGFALINYESCPVKGKKILATIALITTITPVIGATYGGWLAYDHNWRLIFYSIAPISLVMIHCIWKHLGHLKEEKEQLPIDWTGYFFYCLSFTSLITAITLGQQLDWFRSNTICLLLSVGGVSLLFFILWESKHPDPFMDLKLFKNIGFTISILYVALLFSAYFGMVILLSLWLHLFVNYTPIWISLLLIHMAIAGLILFLLVLKWIEKTSPFIPILLALLFFAISSFYSTTFNAEVDFDRIAISRVLAGFALAFFLFPLLIIALQSTPQEKEVQTLGMFQATRLLSGALGCSIYTTIWYRRQIFYHDRLGSQLTPFSEITDQFIQDVGEFGVHGEASRELLEDALQRQSTALALADCFYVMAWVMTILFFILLFVCWKKRLFSAHSTL